MGGAFALEIKIPVPEADLKYAVAKGSLSYTLKVEPEETAEASGKVTLKNGEPEYKAELEKHLRENVRIVGEGKISGKKGSIGICAELKGTKYEKTSIGFEVFEADATKGEVTFLAVVWNAEFAIPGSTVELLGTKWKYSGKIKPEIKLEPNYIEIGKAVGRQVVARAGGAALPIAGGIIGGLALCAAAMAFIEKMEDIGKQSTVVCQEGAARLRAYAESYAATLKGGSGPNKEGNDDGEAYLAELSKYMTRDEAIAECKASRTNYEQEAWAKVAPKMRQSVLEAWDKSGGGKWHRIDNVDRRVHRRPLLRITPPSPPAPA